MDARVGLVFEDSMLKHLGPSSECFGPAVWPMEIKRGRHDCGLENHSEQRSTHSERLGGWALGPSPPPCQPTVPAPVDVVRGPLGPIAPPPAPPRTAVAQHHRLRDFRLVVQATLNVRSGRWS